MQRTPELTQVPQATSMIERFFEVKRSGFLFLTKNTRSIEVTYTYKPIPKSVGETKVPPPLWIEESMVIPGVTA